MTAVKGYDADHRCDWIAETGAKVIPPKRNVTSSGHEATS